ncbi:MAG: hypothetical protein QM820_42270 [Minicystis sp.]
MSIPSASKKKQDAPFTSTDGAAAYRHFLPVVRKIPDDEIIPRGGDAAVARHNVEVGVEAIRPHLAKLKKLLPATSTKALLELPALALALVHADGRVSPSASGGDVDATLGRVTTLRELALTYLEVAAGLDLVPAPRVRAIRAGRGKLDKARDCVDIAGLFHEYQGALAGKHPFSAEQLKELAETGTWLVKNIAPKNVRRATPARDPAAVIRDRFWKALDDGHDQLRTAGVALFGIKNVDANVPPLLTRQGAAKSAAPAAKDAKTPAKPARSTRKSGKTAETTGEAAPKTAAPADKPAEPTPKPADPAPKPAASASPATP